MNDARSHGVVFSSAIRCSLKPMTRPKRIDVFSGKGKDLSTARINEDGVINDITELIEKELNFHINRNGFNYSRFVSHILYLLERQQKNL